MEGGFGENGYIVCMAESLCYPPETVTTLLPPIPTNYNNDKVFGGEGTDSPSLFFWILSLFFNTKNILYQGIAD